MASFFISSPAEVVVIDSRTRSGIITLPLTNSIPYRILNFKDQYGTFSNSTLTLSTQRNETFDDGTTSKVFSNAYTYASLYAISSKWMILNATQTIQQTISSLNVDQINFGSGAGWVQFGPLQASIVSSIQINTNTGYVNNLLLGNNSNATALQYWGTAGNYNNTILAEISTATGIQEFLIFRGSSTSDRVRVQTTGNFVVETGVTSRVWNSNTTATLSNATPAFLINTSSNVGIQTATPQTTLDVAGTARAQILSTLALQTSSINGFTLGTPASSVALFTSNTSNYYTNLLQNYSTMFSTAVSTATLFTSNTSNYYGNLLQNWSTSVSTAALFTSNTSNYYGNLLQNYSTMFSTAVSTATLFTSNTSNYFQNTLQNWSTSLSTTALFTSNTSNYFQNTLQNWSSSDSTISLFTSNTSNYFQNTLQNWSTPLSTIALFTSNSSNYSRGFLQDWSTALSTTSLFTSNTSNFFANNAGGAGTSSLLGIISTGFSTLGLFTSNTSNYYFNVLQNWSTPLSTTALFTSNTSNWSMNLLQNWSTPDSTISLFTSNTSNYFQNTLQNWSTALSTTALFTSNTSNFFANNAGGAGTSSLLGIISTGFSTLGLFTSNTSNYFQNTLQNWSSPLSTATLFTSNTSNWSFNLLQNYSTAVSSATFFTSNTSNWTSNLLQNWSTSVSTTALFTSNTSNFYSNLLQNWSTSLSTTALFTSNTSNWASNLLQNWSTADSTIALFTSNTSNWSRNLLQDWSTQQITIYSFTSNTSNYYSSLLLYDASTILRSSFQSTITNLGLAGYISSSQLVSSVSFLLSNTGGASQAVVTSTIIGLGTFGYISSLSLQSTVTNILNSATGVSQDAVTSSLIGLGTFGYVSSLNVRSTFFVNSDNAIVLPSYASYIVSTGYQYSSSPWGSELAPLYLVNNSYSQLSFSTGDTYLSYTGSNFQDFRITYTCGGNENESHVARPTLTLLISDPISGITEYQTLNTNEVAGASVSLIKTLGQSNTLYFYLRGLSNYTFSSVDESLYQINIESIQPLAVDTFSTIRVSSLSLYDPSTFTFRAITISAGSIYVDGNLAGASGSGGTALTSIPSSLSTFAIFTSSLRASTIQTNLLFGSTLQTQTLLTSSLFTSSLITSTAYLSSFTALTGGVSSLIVSSLTAFSQNVSSLNVSTLSSFFTNTSTLTTTQINFGSGFGYLIMPDIQPNTVLTSTTTTSNLFIGFNSNQSYAGFFGAGAYTNSVIFESNIGGANQELAFFRGASATDRIRLQTTGYIVFEPGVASRTFPAVGSNATPAMVITTASNVGIQTFAPAFPLDVTGTARATTSFSTFLVQTSNLQTTNIQTSNLSSISSVSFANYVLNTSYVNGSTFLQGGVNTPFLTGGPGEIRLATNNTTRVYINTAGNTGFGLTNPSYQVHITSNLYASSMIASSITASSITSFLTLSSVQTFTSSLTGNSFGATNMTSSNMNASTFTGKWNDAVYFTLQEI